MNAEQVEHLIKFIKSGVDLDVAANIVGISMPVIYAVLDRGRVEEERRYSEPKGKVSKETEVCLDFYKKLKAAKAEAVAHVQQAVFTAAKDEWRAAAWWLEKENPRKYSPVVSQEILKNIEQGLAGEIEQ